MKKIFYILLGLFLFMSGESISANDRIALIIGNSKYQNLGSLNNTINDAQLIEKNLKEIGFKTQINWNNETPENIEPGYEEEPDPDLLRDTMRELASETI